MHNSQKKKEVFNYYNHLGNYYPYYLVDRPKKTSLKIADIIQDIPYKNRKIDPVGIIEYINKTYLFGDRTLIKKMKCSPWMARPKNSGWEVAEIPLHKNKIRKTEKVARDFKASLKKEALKYIEGKNKIGILLSGGLDSRIVSGIIKELQLTNEFNGEVVSLTWGLESSRDVYYAQEISRRFNWEFYHYKNGPTQLKNNIEISGKHLGAEVSGLHLHAMPQIRETKGLDAIIAGSYGDGVGRAEFSGKHVLELKKIVPKNNLLLNKFGLVKNNVIKTLSEKVQNDAYSYRKNIFRNEKHQYREIEQEMHYMRRKLQRCMGYINEKTPLYQLYTAPETFSLMWQLDPSIRDERFYKLILSTLPEEIGEIPWARTGRKLNNKNVDIDDKSSMHHKYGYWLRNDLKDYIINLVLNDNIMKLNIFNEKSLEKLIKLWPKANTITTNSIDEIISWLASLSIFIDEYNIQPLDEVEKSYIDEFNSLIGYAHAFSYQKTRDFLRQ